MRGSSRNYCRKVNSAWEIKPQRSLLKIKHINIKIAASPVLRLLARIYPWEKNAYYSLYYSLYYESNWSLTTASNEQNGWTSSNVSKQIEMYLHNYIPHKQLYDDQFQEDLLYLVL